jgi:phage head maturation protease
MTYAIQGIATQFGKCIQHGDKILYLTPGCFDESIKFGSVKLLYDHDQAAFPHQSVELFAGDNALAFRMILPESRNDDGMSDISDDYDTYLGVSIGYKDATTETMTFDGVKVTCVVKATLLEVSLLSKPPAVNTTYGRVVDMDKCSELKDDFEMIQLTGRYVNAHREVKARENDGVVSFNHTTSAYDRAANNFERALQRLAID